MSTLPSLFEFPGKLDHIKSNLRAQEEILRRVAGIYADAIQAGGCVHVYANGHSRLAVEEMCVRMVRSRDFIPFCRSV